MFSSLCCFVWVKLFTIISFFLRNLYFFGILRCTPLLWKIKINLIFRNTEIVYRQSYLRMSHLLPYVFRRRESVTASYLSEKHSHLSSLGQISIDLFTSSYFWHITDLSLKTISWKFCRSQQFINLLVV